jgi:hypothetical protein
MLWAIGSSIFVIYLYRKLSGEQDPQATGSASSNAVSAMELELAKINEQLSVLEGLLVKG